MKRRTVTLVIFFLLSSLMFVCPRLAPSFAAPGTGIEPQRIRQMGRRARRPARPQVDYTRFTHSRPEHNKQSCDSCHSIPAIEEKSQAKTPAALDIKDYPQHESCLGCHRQQFFNGARPAICSNCHNAVSPRSDSRFEFPKKNEGSQFTDVFPHASHVKSTMLIQFKRAFGETGSVQATCTFCHKVNETVFKPTKGAPADSFAPPAGTFMTTPTSHVTCFQCHFQKGVENRDTPPLATQCAQCHVSVASLVPVAPTTAPVAPVKTSSPEAQKPTPTPVPAHAVAQKSPSPSPASQKPAASVAQKSAPSPTLEVAHYVPSQAWPDRIVLKFAHEKDAHKKRTNDDGKEVAITCLQCHTAVRKMMTLEDLRKKENHVQVINCSSSACHTATSGTAQLGLSLYRELRERGKEPKFECALCHTPPYSTAADIPCGHYGAVFTKVKEEAKKKAKPGEEDAEIEKRTKGIKQLTPERCAGEFK